MSASRVEAGLWAVAIALGAAAGVGARAPRDAQVPGVRAVSAPTAPPEHVTRSDIDVAVIALTEADPFRAGRHPSPIAYQPTRDGAPPPPPRATRPGLAVSGIIGGPPWSAVLEGVPGREGGSVVRTGDTLGGLQVRAVRRDTVVVIGMDTTWRLTVRRAW